MLRLKNRIKDLLGEKYVELAGGIEVRIKSKVWWLTIMANPRDISNTFGKTIYVEQDYKSLAPYLQDGIIKHELVHIKQQQKVGLLKYIILYFFLLPILWNKYRWEWEMDAYRVNRSAIFKESDIVKLLRSWTYGCLRNG